MFSLKRITDHKVATSQWANSRHAVCIQKPFSTRSFLCKRVGVTLQCSATVAQSNHGVYIAVIVYYSMKIMLVILNNVLPSIEQRAALQRFALCRHCAVGPCVMIHSVQRMRIVAQYNAIQYHWTGRVVFLVTTQRWTNVSTLQCNNACVVLMSRPIWFTGYIVTSFL